MRKLLEIIVTSVDEARAAEQGGADRLELVRDLHLEGLSPSNALVGNVLAAVSIPVRVMLRTSPDFLAGAESEISELAATAAQLRSAGVSGFVIGFVKNHAIDVQNLRRVVEQLPGCPVTFHRAIEAVRDPVAAVSTLKQFPQIDRVLTSGPSGNWSIKQTYLENLQRAASPQIHVIAGGGLDETSLARLAGSSLLHEFHVGTAARDATGAVSELRVARLRQLLGK